MEDRPMPNATLRTFFKAIEEVMGEKGTRAVLNSAGLQKYINNYPPNNLNPDVTFADYGIAQQAVEDFYGGRGARAMLTQIGRATFRYSLEEQPAVLGLAGLALKLLPENARMRMILNRMVDAANKKVGLEAKLEEDEEAFYMVYTFCPCVFRTRKEKNPCCYTTVGTLQEGMRWATGGKHFRVQEMNCLNIGETECRFRIEKTPME